MRNLQVDQYLFLSQYKKKLQNSEKETQKEEYFERKVSVYGIQNFTFIV